MLRARELFKKLFVVLFSIKSSGDRMKAVSPIMISIKRLKIGHWGSMIFLAERMEKWEMETGRRCRREERQYIQGRWNDSPVSSCSKDLPLKGKTYTQLWWTQTAVFTVRILEIDLLQRCCPTKANLHSLQCAGPKHMTTRFLQQINFRFMTRCSGSS